MVVAAPAPLMLQHLHFYSLFVHIGIVGQQVPRAAFFSMHTAPASFPTSGEFTPVTESPLL